MCMINGDDIIGKSLYTLVMGVRHVQYIPELIHAVIKPLIYFSPPA